MGMGRLGAGNFSTEKASNTMSNRTVRGQIVPNDELVETGQGPAVLRSPDHPMARPWELQVWDSALSYKRFAEFYLTQEPPRSVVEAYRLYRLKLGSAQDQVERIRSVPGTWNNWAYGRDSKGVPIPGALTWAQRGRAFDIEQAQKMMRDEEALWAKRRQELRHVEWEIGTALLARGKRMLSGLLFRKVTEETTSKDGKTIIQQTIYEPTGWGEREAMATLKAASELLRRGAGEPPNNAVIREDWRTDVRLAGVDPEELLDVVHQVLLERQLIRPEG